MRSLKLVLGGALALASLSLALTLTGTATAGAAPSPNRDSCSGTLNAPGLLYGTYGSDVTIHGYCLVDGGPTLIRGNLHLATGAALNATYALNDVAGTGVTSLTVKGDVTLAGGSILAMGCEPNYSPCTDDPGASNGGTLSGTNSVSGDFTATDALAVIMHDSTIKGDVRQSGGGGGLSCNPPTTGVFSQLQSPVFSDYEDNSFSSDFSVTDVHSCWFGALRNTVKGDMTYSGGSFGDPDASEVVSNLVSGDMTCSVDSPHVQYGDSMGVPNKVSGNAVGECSLHAVQPNPAPSGPLTHITIRK